MTGPADTTFDIIVIGGGPGGYVAAIRSSQLGFKTAVVEREHLGGICLNWGCIPTKALLRSAEILHAAQHASDYGLRLTGTIVPDLSAIVARSRGVSKRLNDGVAFLLKKNKIPVIWGEAKITRAPDITKGALGQLTVTTSARPPVQPAHPAPRSTLGAGTYSAQHIIVATGARPRVATGIEPDQNLVWTYFDAMVPKALPKALLVIGSGAIGIEFASFYRALGSEVTVVELLPQILPAEDAEISALARKRFEKLGIKFTTSARVTSLEKSQDRAVATIVDGNGGQLRAEFDRVITAIGVVGNVEGLGLEALGIATDRGTILTDGCGRTNVAGIYAIGDVAGPPMLAHKAEHEGVVCVETIRGLPTHPIEKSMIPGCTYGMPQIASVGLTEAKAKEQGISVRVGRFPFAANGKAIALGEPDGLVKTIFDATTGRLIGAHMVGAEVTELIQGFVVAMNLETTEEELMHTVFPHPTLSEMMHESVLDAYGRAIHN